MIMCGWDISPTQIYRVNNRRSKCVGVSVSDYELIFCSLRGTMV